MSLCLYGISREEGWLLGLTVKFVATEDTEEQGEDMLASLQLQLKKQICSILLKLDPTVGDCKQYSLQMVRTESIASLT